MELWENIKGILRRKKTVQKFDASLAEWVKSGRKDEIERSLIVRSYQVDEMHRLGLCGPEILVAKKDLTMGLRRYVLVHPEAISEAVEANIVPNICWHNYNYSK